MNTSVILVIAHRGASTYAPENTFAAYDLALKMGCHHIELDVDFSSDGHIVVIHDDSVDRTTDGSGRVASLSLAELQALDAGSWFDAAYANARIPTYREVLERYKGRVHLHTEIKGKSPALAPQVADLIRTHRMEDQVTITSFQDVRLKEMREYAPGLPTGWLVREVNEEVISRARELGVTQLCPQASVMTVELVRRLHNEGFVARAWGVSNEDLMEQAVRAGADGMTVNFPDKLIEYLENNGYRWD